LRAGAPALYGSADVPSAILARADELGTELRYPGHGFEARIGATYWDWQGQTTGFRGLVRPRGGEVQVANQSLALAAVEALEPRRLEVLRDRPGLLADKLPPGRAQRHTDQHRWLLDVAHNPQAARALRAIFANEPPATVILGMLADKQAEAFAAALELPAARWITVPSQGFRGSAAEELAARLTTVTDTPPQACRDIATAFAEARRVTPEGGLILVCGSFSVVGPALAQLGLY